jgi:hypothetical protein
VRSPSSVSASRTDETYRGSATNGRQVLEADAPDVDAHDRAQRHQRGEVAAAIVVVERDRVAAAAELLQHGEQVVLGRVGGDLQHGAVRAHGRRADLDEEVAGDRQPGGVAPGELLEPDVAERVDEQGGGRLASMAGSPRSIVPPKRSS